MRVPALVFNVPASLQPYTGEGSWGQTFGPVTDVFCSGVSQASAVTIKAVEQDTTVMGETNLLVGAEVPLQSKITIDGTTYRAVGALKPRSMMGPTHVKAVLGP